ncbi:DUF2126 domain-containing protein [Haliangium sp.]|uniref:transglutaminase family protein n=1 Tax=Haliangium sp. TaxID=2663208 RepID=UPI003D128766
MRVRIKHETEYRFDTPAALGPHLVRLRPAGHTRTQVLSYNLAVAPACELRWQYDPWSNRVARLTFDKDEPISGLRLTVDAAFDIRPLNPFDFYVDDRCEAVPFTYPDGLADELAPFLAASSPGPALARFLEAVPAHSSTIDFLVALNQHVAATVNYIIRAEPGIQSSEETLTLGRGSCRDSAVLLVDALRCRGLAARFVSGYLVQLADEGIIPDQAKGVSQDVVDLHAWAEVYLPGAGWVGLDGTSGLLCTEGHIPLACAVDPVLAAPVSGTSSVAAGGFAVRMEVARLGHEPRPRMPYTDEDWADLLDAGDRVDEILREHGLTLTSGGEPTFTSREAPRAPEWNTQALGPSKWSQGLRLADELARRFPPGSLIMQRMGKQYPGESLPRWALELIWRHDGTPIWRDRERLRLGHPGGGEAAAQAGEGDRLEAAQRLAEALTVSLGLSRDGDAGEVVIPAYEDPWHFVAAEQNLPPGVDPLAADLGDPEARRRLARVLGHGLGRPVGFAVPLARGQDGWRSGGWEFRRGRLHLIPGDSPMGLRLPLDRLDPGAEIPPAQDPSAVAARLAFDPHQPRRQYPYGAEPAPPAPEQGAPRTALCVEPRAGVVHVFLPPLAETEHFLELVAAIEDTAAAEDLGVAIEGYRPPPDPRIDRCLVTPDPGVIEVNLPVSTSVRGYARLLADINDAANHAGLCTEKYQIDGREIGSGGGNHLTLGGPTPQQSPFLRRPDLLAGMLRYIQNHPALSFLFTGLFVGPTSQAPRIDEARHDSLYELELALDQVPPGPDPARAEDAPAVMPWTVDRLLRNLLVDITGNTHRSEICIDKLYDPAGAAGRQGLIELRAFEMPPHERMAAAQMLLARALVARMAQEPYQAGLVRWGTELHDRFMLPHYLWADMADVVSDFARVGLPLRSDWFVPFLDHRCPVVGLRQLGDIQLELRTALEPWPTLGEEPSGAATARYVDSSLERLQLKVSGLTPGRHQVLVNGVRVPMRATGTAAEQVAGIRFRAWQPPHCLQPHIGVHHPLRFDVVDTWGKRSLGGCTYHVWHPEGRAYDEPPLTAFEAAARRAQRFTTEGHAPWPVEVEPAEPHPEFPYTLDLRRYSTP